MTAALVRASRRWRRQPAVQARRPAAAAAHGVRRRPEGHDLMNDRTAWHTANDAYLAAALLWLRLRLQRLAEEQRVPGEASAPRGAAGGSGARAKEETAPRASCAGPHARPDRPDRAGRGGDAKGGRCGAAARAGDSEPSAGARAFRGADPAAVRGDGARHAHRPRSARQAQGDVASRIRRSRWLWRCSTIPVWEALSPERPLRHWRLIEINQPGAQPLTAQRAARRRARGQLSEGPQLRRRSADAISDAACPSHPTPLPPTHQRQVGSDRPGSAGGPRTAGGALCWAPMPPASRLSSSQVGARLELERVPA